MYFALKGIYLVGGSCGFVHEQSHQRLVLGVLHPTPCFHLWLEEALDLPQHITPASFCGPQEDCALVLVSERTCMGQWPSDSTGRFSIEVSVCSGGTGGAVWLEHQLGMVEGGRGL